MAHDLTIRRNGRAEMAYTGETPWHGLGASLAPGAGMDAWRDAAGMDWQILRAAVRYPTNPDDANNPAAWRRMEDRHVLIRSDNGNALGVVSDRYQEVQPADVLDFFRELTAAQGFAMETAGTLKGGKRFWALARVAEDAAVIDARDRVGGYLLLSTSADGTMATEARLTAIRVVCQNTLSAALRSGTAGAHKTAHNRVWDADAAKAALGIAAGDARRSFAEAMDTFRGLAETPLATRDMVRMTLEAFGHDPARMTARELEDAAGKPAVAGIGHMAATGQGMAGAELRGAGPGSMWGWVNAVTQYVDHHARARSRDNRLESAWFGRGDALKSRALEMAVEAAGGGGRAVTYRDADDAGPSLGASMLDAVLAVTDPSAG